jgi:probable biosynthetic protein (TIGR04098 family)
MRMTPPDSRLGRRWLPDAPAGASPPDDAVIAPAIARQARAARRGEAIDDAWLGPLLARADAAPLGVVPHEPSPYADYNGAGLLYFASYVTIADTAERRLVRRLDLAPAAARGRDWALATSAVRRDVFFYENLPLGASLDAALMVCDADVRGVTTHVRLRRRAEDGGRVMADVATRRIFVRARQSWGAPRS